MNVLVKPKITKPWSNEMYSYNDEVADMMKNNIIKSIKQNKNNWNTLNELMSLCGGVRYGEGYELEELYKDTLNEVDTVQNYWLREEYPYAVSKGLVKDIMYEFVGYE